MALGRDLRHTTRERNPASRANPRVIHPRASPFAAKTLLEKPGNERPVDRCSRDQAQLSFGLCPYVVFHPSLQRGFTFQL